MVMRPSHVLSETFRRRPPRVRRRGAFRPSRGPESRRALPPLTDREGAMT